MPDLPGCVAVGDTQEEIDSLIREAVANHVAMLRENGLLSVESCERWLAYRDARNDTAHRYGAGFAEVTLKLLPAFIADATELAKVIAEEIDE